MGQISKRVQERFVCNLKLFQSIIAGATSHDVNESDTVIIVADMLSDIFDADQIRHVLEHTVLKRDLDEGEKAVGAVFETAG